MDVHLVRRLAFVLVVVVAAGSLAGCGGDGDEGDTTQRQLGPDVSTFVGATLDDIPVPPRAEPLSPASETDGGIRVRSWEVRNTTVDGVLEFYEDLFADRPEVSPVSDAPGAGRVLRGEWRLEDGIVRVTAQPAPTLEEQDGSQGSVVQLSLQLTPG